MKKGKTRVEQPQQQKINPETIKQMFASVAKNYDKANSVLSLGIHHIWRTTLVNCSGAEVGDSVLDCATGTGDLAIQFKKVVGETGTVIGTDFCDEMLKYAPAKAEAQNLNIKFELADVMNLQYPDNSFDIVSISFGIRNVANPALALKEMARVVRPGGHVMVLEFGQIKLPVIGPLYAFYSEKVLPKLGGWVTGQEKAYEYLQKSSQIFPCRDQFTDLMMSTREFECARYKTLSAGIAYVYMGEKKSN
jgi:demethylmenaquinone methyltransferase/2-methoxy-6-polyprenyl-1,4-benzoquinol methylase